MSTSCNRMSAPLRTLASWRHSTAVAQFEPGSAQSVSRGYIRIGIAKEVTAVLRDLGADPEHVIRQADLDPKLFNDGSNVIPFASLGQLFAQCVAHTGCQHFGLLVGQRATISSLGPVGGLMLHSATVGDALHSLVSHLHLREPGAVPTLAISGDVALLSYAVYEPQVRSLDQIADGTLATAMNVMSTLCGREWTPEEVLLPRRPSAALEAYRRFFRAPIRFDQEIAALAFPTQWLEHRIAGADPVFRQVFEAKVRELETAHVSGLKDDLRRVLRARILNDRCSADAIANLFAVHRRTLSRHLRAEGTGFRHLVDEVRFEIARQLLTDTEIPLCHIAAALGYSEASAFTRAFQRWSGRTPSAWRARTHTRASLDNAA